MRRLIGALGIKAPGTQHLGTQHLGTQHLGTQHLGTQHLGPKQPAPLTADRRAVTALEYGIVAAFFCVGLVTIFRSFGTSVTALFNTIITRLS